MIKKAWEMTNAGNYDMLDILHHFTSGLKAYVSNYAYIAMDEMR